MKMKTLKHRAFLGFTTLLLSTVAQAQVELAKIPSNFDSKVWARPTEFMPNVNFPNKFGQLMAPCSFSHLKYDDPIQKPGQASQAPLHVFFGNTTTNASSTYQSLRSNGDGTCFGGPLNRSAFYLPSMMNGAGQVVLPDFLDVLYNGDATTRAFPRGLRMVFGFNEAKPTEYWHIDDAKYFWGFGANGENMGAKASWGEILRFQTLDSAKYPAWAWKNSGYGISIRLISPSCWNGTSLDSADHRSHMAYKLKDSSGALVCPSTHPVNVPEVVLTAYYKFVGQQATALADVKTWYLSSDRFGGRNYAPGTNIYAGMIPAWDDDIMQVWVTNILNGIKYGAMGKIGDGRILDKPATSKMYGPTSFKPFFLWSLKTTDHMGAPQGAANNNLIAAPAR